MQELKGDGAGFGALGAHATPNCLLRVLRHEALQFSLGALVFEKCWVSSSKRAGKFRPGIGNAHIDDADRRNAGLRWLDPEERRGLAALDTPPKLPLGSDNEVLVERVGMGSDLDPFAAASDDRQDG